MEINHRKFSVPVRGKFSVSGKPPLGEEILAVRKFGGTRHTIGTVLSSLEDYLGVTYVISNGLHVISLFACEI